VHSNTYAYTIIDSLFDIPLFLNNKLSPADRFLLNILYHQLICIWHGKLAQVMHTSVQYLTQEFSSSARYLTTRFHHLHTVAANSSWITCCNVQMTISAVSLSGSPRSPLSIVLPPQLRTCVSRRFAFSFLILHLPAVFFVYYSGVRMQTGRGREACRPPRCPPLLFDHCQIPLDSWFGVFGKLHGLP
jgi:hypothetical protein